MEGWRSGGRGRRKVVLAAALLAHAVLIGAMLFSRVSHERAVAETGVETTIWLTPAPAPARVTRAQATPVPPRPTRLRSIPHAAADAQAIQAPPLEPQPIARAASAAEPPASAALQPLNLTLTRDQLRAVIAGSRPTLAQSLARPPPPSPLARIGGDDDTYSEKALPHGETEVHSHGGCFKMVPTPAARYDPFNHGGGLPGNCN